MTATTTTRPRPKRKPRPQGQWLVDGTIPLNDDEKIKQEDAGLGVIDRIRETYAKQGFDSIPKEDLAPRFKWVGLYTQRRPGLDGVATSTLSTEELQDNYFMMRIRLDGGLVSSEQLRVIGEISSDYARDTADFTDRQNVQLHWIRIEDVPTIWDKLEAVGLDTNFGCGDVPRVILGSPVAGIAADEIIDATPAIHTIKEELLTSGEFDNLPRKFKSAISGNSRQDVTHEIQDLAFIGSNHPEHGPGFDVWVGGGLSTNPMLSQRLGAWVPLDEVPEVWAGVVRIFRDYGYRKVRNRARLKFLVADWGVEKFRKVLEEDYLGRKLVDGPDPGEYPGYRDHIGIHEQRDGKVYLGVKPTVGHTDGAQLQRLAELAESYGSTRLRTTPDKELLFLDLTPENADKLAAELEKEGLSAKPSAFRRDIISCTGLEFCKLAHVVTKQRAIQLVDELEERVGDLDVPLKISLNGCPNSCARSQVADIGLSGKVLTDEDGNRVEGFQVHLGGKVGLEPGFGRKLRGNNVFSEDVGDYVVRVVENFKEQREDGEEFSSWVARAEEEALR
ncbi:nitrite/sulfite reductase [Corynebacterium sp.]|uniref:nitrite/sulfite reductase n=1 Tax=Corynebacterium sp. TaxID=1720 RepID=UPI002601AAA5|nr:nitrite/sulfite reductase [Corynebacterium sp.]